MGFRLSLSLLLLLVSLQGQAQTRQVTLAELIEGLRARGNAILYSDGLVDDSRVLDPGGDMDRAALETALAQQGLVLIESQGVWLVVREPDKLEASDAPPDKLAAPVLETVIVTGTLYRMPAAASGASRQRLHVRDLANSPQLASDPLRAVLRLPGVASVGVSARPHIRGGLQDELLFLRDGVELLEPFHLADYHSPYSAIDSYGIESVDFYTGGFPSRYGNRMSGVMDVSNDWRQSSYGTRLGVSSFSRFLSLRRTTDAERPLTIYAGYRDGDLSDLTDYLQSRSGSPKYSDASLGLHYSPFDALQLEFGAVLATDDVRFSDEEEEASAQVDVSSLWLEAGYSPGEGHDHRLTLSWLEMDRRKRLISAEEGEEKGGFLDHRQDVRRLALRHDVALVKGDALYEIGWQADYGRADYRHSSLINRGELAQILATQQLVNRSIAVQPDGWSAGAYAQVELPLGSRLLLQPSLRWDWQNYYLSGGARQQLSPRLGAAFDLSPNSRLRLGFGRFYQPEGIQELQVLDGITEYFRPQHVDQFLAGLDWSRNQARLTAEVYEKRYGELKGRFENMFNPFVLLPEMEPDRVALVPDRARARGVDLQVTHSWSSGLQGFLRYSWLDVDDRIDGRWIPRRWSQGDTVNAGLQWQRGNLTLGVAASWHSGWRSSRLPAYVPPDTVIPAVTVLNNTRLAEYLSLDIALRWRREFDRFELAFFADISNVSDRRNIAGLDFDVEEIEDDPGGYLLSPDRETLLGKVPSIGVTLSF